MSELGRRSHEKSTGQKQVEYKDVASVIHEWKDSDFLHGEFISIISAFQHYHEGPLGRQSL